MKRLLITILFLMPYILISQVTYNFNNSTDSWIGGNYTTVSQGTSYVTVTLGEGADDPGTGGVDESNDGYCGSSNPYFEIGSAGIDPSNGGILAVTMKNNTSNTRMQIIISRGSDPQTTNFDAVNTQEAGFNTYYFDISGNSNWTGTVDQVSFRPKISSSDSRVNTGTIFFDKIEQISSIPTDATNTFDFNGSLDGWSGNNYANASAGSGYATISMTNASVANPNFETTTANINSSLGNVLAVTLKNSSNNTRLRVILTRSSSADYIGDYTINTNDSDFVTYFFDIADNGWNGTINEITLRPQTASNGSAATGTIYIDEIKVVDMGTDIYTRDLRIASGETLIIKPSGSLTISGTLYNDGELIMESKSNEYSSLISGSKSGSGTYTYKNYTDAPSGTTTADLISAPFSGEDFSTLNSNNSGAIITNPSDATQYLFGTFNSNSGAYVNFDSDTDGSTTTNAGVGYRAGTNEASELFFSEYAEGSGYQKYVEIYNGTGSTVDLDPYSITIHSSGSASANYTINFSANTNLNNGDVYVVANSNSQATDQLGVLADKESGAMAYNGDDAVLLNKNGTLIDIIGGTNGDPGSGWAVAGVNNATKDKKLMRKSYINSPNATNLGSLGTNSTDSEWIVYDKDSKWYTIGNHSGVSTISFTGTFDFDGDTESISIGSHGTYGKWNLIGNPFPSYIDLNHFYSDNTSSLDDTYNYVAAYDADSSNGSVWTYYNNSNTSGKYIAPGQGFFVAAAGNETISFDHDMKSISGSDDFISGDNMENTEVELRIYNDNSAVGNTKLFFDEGLNNSLDIGWDAGHFDENASIMTRLVEEDEGHGMAINAMGLDAMENAVIPLVINQAAGQEFRVNLHTATIPDPNVYLEDVEEGTFTNLYEGDFVYTPTSDLEGVGRFFIHMTADTMSNEGVSTSMLNAYKQVGASYITIEGLATQTNNINVSLYNILGRKVLDTSLSNNINSQTISTVGMASGIYIIELESGNDRLTKKLIIQ